MGVSVGVWRIAVRIWLVGFAVSSLADDRDALEALYDALGGEHWQRSEGWLSDAPLGEWHGVLTAEGRVTVVDLAGNGLRGTLPYHVGDLSALEHLDLRWNAIAGDLPSELGDLAALETLLLTGNELTGEIPWTLGGLSRVKRLDLSYNGLEGEIPGQLGDLKQLASLGLHSNRLTGEIPWELTRIPGLKRLILTNNRLVGSVPIELSDSVVVVHAGVGDEVGDAVGEDADLDIAGKVEWALTAGGLLDRTTRHIDDEGFAVS